MRIQERWQPVPDYTPVNRSPHAGLWSAFEEERQEALHGVLEALAEQPPDADRTAACRRLLRHLSGFTPSN